MRHCFKVYIYCILIALAAISCSTTSTLPEGSYLLNKNTFVVDSRAIDRADLSTYAQQKPNDPKILLAIYNMANGDTSKWIKRQLMKLGDEPVIYSQSQAMQSAKEMEVALNNKGYLRAQVLVSTDTTDRKINATYTIFNNGVYTISKYTIDAKDKLVDSIIQNYRHSRFSQLDTGKVFNMALLEKERENISTLMRNRGYFDFNVDKLHYYADTNLNQHKVDLQLSLVDTLPPTSFNVSRIRVISGFDPMANTPFKPVDTVLYKNLEIIYDSSRFIRPSMLSHVVKIRNGKPYSERYDKLTYTYIGTLRNVSRGNIQYVPITDSTLLCNIYLTQGNIHGIQTGLDGTNKAGDLGIAANVLYSHYNIFNGSEQFDIRLRGAYEFISRNSMNLLGQSFISFGIGTSLSFPQVSLPFFRSTSIQERFTINSAYSVGFDVQRRPEYIREFFNFNWRYNMVNEQRTISQSIALVNVNYIIIPWMSDEFADFLEQPINALSRYSFENVFTAGFAYNLTLTNANPRVKKRYVRTIRYSLETSGNLAMLLLRLWDTPMSASGARTILGNPLAQYVKNDIAIAHTFQFAPKHAIAFNTAVGLAVPYGNSTILPFEKRYFAGGPNSVRGWQTRYLGPGSFVSENLSNPAPNVGDIRLELSIEYRYKWMKYLEPAVFFDAGNIWTIRNYDNQPGGLFQPSSFYKEIAMGTGMGIRFDFGFLIVRIDAGKQVYNPARHVGNRWTFLEPFRNNSAAYFAIGYPF